MPFMASGFGPDFLFKVDQLIWSARRHCRPSLRLYPSSEADQVEAVEVDWFYLLRNNDRLWSMGSSFLPIEELLKRPSHDQNRPAFLKVNLPFAPDLPHKLEWRLASLDSPLA